jgi:beta-glucosidase
MDDKVYYSEGLYVGYRGYDQLGIEPQYPFGYGLSYTTFEYGNLTVEAQKTDGTQTIEVSFEIANTGNRAGVEVAQLYIGLPASSSAPLKRLVGWERVALKSGESKQVSVTIDPCSSERPLSFWNVATQSWEIADGDYMMYLAASARDIKHSAGFKLQTIREKLRHKEENLGR